MKVAIGSDHAGVDMKEEIKMVLMERDNLDILDRNIFIV